MAVDPLPNLNNLVNEGLNKAGFTPESLSNSAILTRARLQWMPEIKNDIFTDSKKLKSLQKTAVQVLTPGLSRYANPPDYSSDLTMQLAKGSVTGTATAGSSSSITLANVGDAVIGNRVLITGGTGVGSMSQIISIDSSTLIATVSPDFEDAPAVNSTYRIITRLTPIKQRPLWDLTGNYHNTTSGDPRWYFPVGNDENNEFELFPIPGTAYGLQFNYYADLLEIDITSQLMTTLYKRWRNVFIQGIFFRALDSVDDDKTEENQIKYQRMLLQLKSREQYGTDLHELQATCSDY